MGKIFATCGHELADIPDKGVMRKAYGWEGRAVEYLVLCPECERKCREDGDVLDTDSDAARWLAEDPSPVDI